MLGDRSLKLKHLNANTLFVASGDGRALTASLLDTVTGRFLHRQIHAARARAPPRAVCARAACSAAPRVRRCPDVCVVLAPLC